MFFDPNQTVFSGEKQRVIWQFGTHIVPLDISLADVDDAETIEGCKQIYDCTMEILSDMYNNPDWYKEKPRWYTGDYLAWLANQNKPMKKHSDEFFRYLQKIFEFGFYYNEDSQKWSNDRYPLFFEYFGRLVVLAKERKQNLGGYLDRRDFRLFAKKIVLSFDDLLRPLSDANKEQALETHRYAVEKGMKADIKDPYNARYIYKKLYSLEIHNNLFDVLVPYRLDNGKYIPNQFAIFLEVAEGEPDADDLIWYIKGGIRVCNCCNGTKKAKERCSNWVNIRGERRLSAACHPAIGKYRRGTHSFDYNDYDIKMLKRMIDVRIKQVDKFRDEQKGYDMLKEQISLPEYDFISNTDKEFIVAFTDELEKLGFYEDGFGNGFCWGRYMVIYRKSAVKSKNVYTRIYIRENSICLRMFFNDVSKHGDYIENTPDFIKDVFTGDYGKCKHCKGDNCKFRKDYEISGVKYEKCNGYTFEFYFPTTDKLTAYIDLFKVFYCRKGGK